MAKSSLSRERLEQIVATQMPGFTLADDAETDAVVHADAQYTSPALDDLQRKYLADAPDYVEVAEAASFTAEAGAANANAPNNPVDAATADDADDLGMIAVNTRTLSGDVQDNAVRPTRKAVVVSASTGRIIGAQG